MKKAFTLAEVMIVLAIIGILTAILLPVAQNATPNENILKFKKAHNALYITIREFVTSDKYYSDGDLGVKVDGTLLDGTHDNDYQYFCSTLVDVLNIKKHSCAVASSLSGHRTVYTKSSPTTDDFEENLKVTPEILENAKKYLDIECASDLGRQLGKQMIFDNGTVFYETTNIYAFGEIYDNKRRYGSDKNALIYDTNGFGVGYKLLCIDVDGMNNDEIDVDLIVSNNGWLDSTSECDDLKDICPFGYGIRADGKILNGKRAEEWLEKSIQEK